MLDSGLPARLVLLLFINCLFFVKWPSSISKNCSLALRSEMPLPPYAPRSLASPKLPLFVIAVSFATSDLTNFESKKASTCRREASASRFSRVKIASLALWGLGALTLKFAFPLMNFHLGLLTGRSFLVHTAVCGVFFPSSPSYASTLLFFGLVSSSILK